jgi:hypothetical protein
MARRISSSRGRSGGSGFRANRSSGSSSRMGGFRPSSSRNVGGYRYRYRPYRRNYFFYSLGPVGKIAYILFIIIITFLYIIITST